MQATTLDFVVIVVYFLGILAFGAWFSRYTKSTSDFFFGGQRFSWWLIAMSCVATVVGSYSFMKYSAAGFRYGLSSSMTYLNDWLIMPFFLLGWFPIIYFMRITSIPEYFEKRFDRKTRIASLVLILIYMIGYVGINFYTLGVALEPILGINLYYIVIAIAVISAIYMHAGGQTSVIMTDLLQGFVLLLAGFFLLFLGLDYIGGFDIFWNALPNEHRLPLAAFNTPPKFNFVGIFWQDALASSVAFYFMNQGVLMRFMSVKSYKDGYKAMITIVLILMPIAALAIANSGWMGRAMVTQGMIPADTDPNKIFVVVASLVTQPGIFGLILSALAAALMSTIDTLITAISAIFVNDIWKPFVKPDRDDAHYLKVARWTAIVSAVIGVLLVPMFAQEKSIYVAHGKFISTVTPAMIVVILMSVFWKRFTPNAAFWTLILGSLSVTVTSFVPELITPIAHGIDPSGGYKFMRAFFGIVISMVAGIGISYLTKPKPDEELKGLTVDSFEEAKAIFKGGKPNEVEGDVIKVAYQLGEAKEACFSQSDMDSMAAHPGDILYVSDERWFFGGLRSVHIKAGKPHDKEGVVFLPQSAIDDGHFSQSPGLTAEKLI